MNNPKTILIGSEVVTVKIDYTNHRGQTAMRTVRPVSLAFGESKYHAGRQLILVAWDLDKQQYRDFAVKDIHKWEEL